MSWLVNTEKLAGTLHFKAKPKQVVWFSKPTHPRPVLVLHCKTWLGTAINAIFALLTLWLQKFP